MTSNDQINEFFADCTDWELCNVLDLVIENFYGFDSLRHHQPHIPHERWVIHCVWSTSGFLDCEGYWYFWGTDLDQHGYADALEEIGFEILPGILRDSIALVPPEMLGDWDAMEAHKRSEDAREEDADLMDEKFISNHPDYTGKLARYARDRRFTFADIYDELVSTRKEKREMLASS
jgi:hypothetical protein